MRKPSMLFNPSVKDSFVKLDLLSAIDESLIVDLESTTKEDALHEMIDIISRSSFVQDKAALATAIFEREKTLSTGIGIGVAVPHAKLASVSDKVVAIGRSRQGIDFESLDAKPVHIIAMIAIPEIQSKEYLKLLAGLVFRLKEASVRKRILEAPDRSAIRTILAGTSS